MERGMNGEEGRGWCHGVRYFNCSPHIELLWYYVRVRKKALSELFFELLIECHINMAFCFFCGKIFPLYQGGTVMPENKKIAIFDVDEVLLDMWGPMHKMLEDFQRRKISEDEWVQIIRDFDRDPRPYFEFGKYFMSSDTFERLNAKRGMKDVLKKLADNGWDLAIVTSAPPTKEVELKRRKNLHYAFGDIFKSIDCVGSKDKKSRIADLAEKYEESMFVDDNPAIVQQSVGIVTHPVWRYNLPHSYALDKLDLSKAQVAKTSNDIWQIAAGRLFNRRDLDNQKLQQKIIETAGKKFEVIKINPHLRVAALPEIAEKIKGGTGRDFLSTMDGYAKEIAALPLAYKTPPVFSFVVLPRGELFKKLSGSPFPNGMAGALFAVDENYPMPLAVDEKWFEAGFSTEDSVQRKTGLCHELAHTVHSAWFSNLGVLNEGFAELLPHYLMNLQVDNEAHCQAVAKLVEEDMRTIGDIEECGIFSKEDLTNRQNTQERKGYLSAYLWMLGYTKRVEEKFDVDKFGAVNLILAEFEKLSKNLETSAFDGVEALVGLPLDTLQNTLQLQKEGQRHVAKMGKTKEKPMLLDRSVRQR